jgi:hypothetical protein
MAKLMSQAEFIQRCIKKYGNWFDYSKVEYKNAITPVLIGCCKHGWFNQTPWKHYYNAKGCSACGHAYGGSKKRKNTKDFLFRSLKVHGKLYDYSKSKYITANDKIEIICKRHGSFWQIPRNHFGGNGCPRCRNLYTTEYFINEATKIHNNYYEYSLVEYGRNDEKVKIKCPLHGLFEQKAHHHLQGKGCPACRLSKGELRIKKWLSDHCIAFEQQKIFDDCVNPKTHYKLKYDFYLPSYNSIVEYQGKQHYEMFNGWLSETEERFKNRQYKDQIKEKYLKMKKINLIKIKYTIKNIESFLQRKLDEVRANALK